MVTWDDAQHAALRMDFLARDCAPAGYNAARESSKGWALPLYALAGELGCAASAVDPAALRYRMQDQQGYLRWLCAQLQRMGHRVSAPLRLDDLRRQHGLGPDDDPALTLAGRGDVAHDPVALRWTAGTLTTAEHAQMSDGLTVTMPASCPLWDALPGQLTQLDDLLTVARGGWWRGARVRTRGIPPYTSRLGATAAESGVHPTRAAISRPVWTVDDTARTLAPGPPSAYVLTYRDRDTGAPTSNPVQVPAQHLELDLDPWPDPAGHPDPTATIPVPAPAAVPPSRAASRGTGDGDPHPADGEVRADDAAALLPDGVVEQPEPADPQQRYRQGALARLWELRDSELALAGDSTPQRVAERITNDRSYPKPAASMTSWELRKVDDLDRQQPSRLRWAPEAPDQQLVSGRWREQLVQWLPEVVNFWCTARQREALDGFTAETTLTQVRTMLAAEGFVQVADLHGNGGRPIGPAEVTALTLDRALPDPADVGPGAVDLVLCHPTDALLAAVHAWDSGDKVLKIQSVRIYFNVRMLDRELFDLALRAGYMRDVEDRVTGVRYGSFSSQPSGTGLGAGLRVPLAALRAFSWPVAPWRIEPHVHLGGDGADQRSLHQIMMGQLPAWVRDLLGPELYNPRLAERTASTAPPTLPGLAGLPRTVQELREDPRWEIIDDVVPYVSASVTLDRDGARWRQVALSINTDTGAGGVILSGDTGQQLGHCSGSESDVCAQAARWLGELTADDAEEPGIQS